MKSDQSEGQDFTYLRKALVSGVRGGGWRFHWLAMSDQKPTCNLPKAVKVEKGRQS